MNRDLYRQLAAAGNRNAKRILDSEDEEEEGAETEETEDEGEEEGATPEAEMGEENSEEQELAELTELAQQIGRLVAKAEMAAEAGEHGTAGDAHFELGGIHEESGDAEKARDAFKAAAAAYKNQLDACAGMSPEQIQAWHARENAE